MTLSVPTIHLNGTSEKELMAQLSNALDALEGAMTALRAANPNGRDYYPQGSEAIVEAGRQHSARVAKIKSVYDELELIGEAIVQREAA